jgi:hypothetical protein
MKETYDVKDTVTDAKLTLTEDHRDQLLDEFQVIPTKVSDEPVESSSSMIATTEHVDVTAEPVSRIPEEESGPVKEEEDMLQREQHPIASYTEPENVDDYERLVRPDETCEEESELHVGLEEHQTLVSVHDTQEDKPYSSPEVLPADVEITDEESLFIQHSVSAEAPVDKDMPADEAIYEATAHDAIYKGQGELYEDIQAQGQVDEYQMRDADEVQQPVEAFSHEADEYMKETYDVKDTVTDAKLTLTEDHRDQRADTHRRSPRPATR